MKIGPPTIIPTRVPTVQNPDLSLQNYYVSSKLECFFTTGESKKLVFWRIQKTKCILIESKDGIVHWHFHQYDSTPILIYAFVIRHSSPSTLSANPSPLHSNCIEVVAFAVDIVSVEPVLFAVRDFIVHRPPHRRRRHRRHSPTFSCPSAHWRQSRSAS